MSDLIPTTTFSMRRRHWSRADLMEASPVGLSGVPLCSKSGLDRVHDQAWCDDDFARYGWRKVVIANLPLCKRCEKAAARPGVAS